MPTEAQRRANKNYRERNREKYNETQLKYSIKYWENNKETILEKKKDFYENSFRKEQNRLFRILIK